MKTATYLEKFYSSNDIADIMEPYYNIDILEDMTKEDEDWLNDYEGDWNRVCKHADSKYWR